MEGKTQNGILIVAAAFQKISPSTWRLAPVWSWISRRDDKRNSQHGAISFSRTQQFLRMLWLRRTSSLSWGSSEVCADRLFLLLVQANLWTELRDEIYDFTFSYDGVQQNLSSTTMGRDLLEFYDDNKWRYCVNDYRTCCYRPNLDKQEFDDSKDSIICSAQCRKTPGILLVNRAVSSDAISRLRKKQLTLYEPPCMYERCLALLQWHFFIKKMTGLWTYSMALSVRILWNRFGFSMSRFQQGKHWGGQYGYIPREAVGSNL